MGRCVQLCWVAVMDDRDGGRAWLLSGSLLSAHWHPKPLTGTLRIHVCSAAEHSLFSALFLLALLPAAVEFLWF